MDSIYSSPVLPSHGQSNASSTIETPLNRGDRVKQTIAQNVQVGNTLLHSREAQVSQHYDAFLTDLIAYANTHRGFYVVKVNQPLAHYPHPIFLFGLANAPDAQKHLRLVQQAINNMIEDKNLSDDIRWLALFVAKCTSSLNENKLADSLLLKYQNNLDWNAYFDSCSPLNKIMLKQLIGNKGSITPHATLYYNRILQPEAVPAEAASPFIADAALEEEQPAIEHKPSGLKELIAAYHKGATFWDGNMEFCINNEEDLNTLLDENGEIK